MILPKFEKIFIGQKKYTSENTEATPEWKICVVRRNNGKLWRNLWCERKNGVVCLPPLTGTITKSVGNDIEDGIKVVGNGMV